MKDIKEFINESQEIELNEGFFGELKSIFSDGANAMKEQSEIIKRVFSTQKINTYAEQITKEINAEGKKYDEVDQATWKTLFHKYVVIEFENEYSKSKYIKNFYNKKEFDEIMNNAIETFSKNMK